MLRCLIICPHYTSCKKEAIPIKKPRVTARDVAKEANVSPATVSMILNNYKHIHFTEETKSRVLNACDRLGYRTFGNSRLNNVTGKVLLVVCPTLQNTHYTKMITGIQQRAIELGYTPLTMCTRRQDNEEANVIHLCRELRVAGVALIYQPENKAILQLLNMQIPIVQVYEKAENLGLNTIELDNFKIGWLIAEHLIGLGHRYIAHVSKPLTDKQPARIRRVDGICACMRAHNLDPQKYLRVSTVETEHLQGYSRLEGYETGYLLASHLVDSGVPVTAFTAANDTMAYGIMDAILERGKKIPQDYSVCGCDNLQDSKYQRISLTTVEPYTMEKARDAVDLLVREIESQNIELPKEDSPISITRIEYTPRLIARKSTGKCADKIQSPTHISSK